VLDLINPAKRAARARPIELTGRQFRLLEFLVRQAGNLVTRTMLFEGGVGL